MLIILVAALLPLGLIAVLASIESAQTNRAGRDAATRVLAIDSGRILSATLARTALTLRAATTALAGNPDPVNCARTLGSLAAAHHLPVDFAIFAANGELICATRDFLPVHPRYPGDRTRVDLAPDGEALRVIVGAAGGQALGVAELSRGTITEVSLPHTAIGGYRLALVQGPRTMHLAELGISLLSHGVTTTVPVAGDGLGLRMTMVEARVTAIELLLVLLPLLMLLAAATIGWLVVDRLVLRPLKQLHGAVSAYRAGDRELALPELTTPAHEIRTLGEAFRGVTETISHHESELEEGLARQTRLTREVHHRVKNNLQVVASLLNLHARSAVTPEAADAYASIQRRVDALAVVHRNHFAELEENRGVALKPLIGELAANLRANAPPRAAGMQISLDIRPFHVTQDVAVAVAFLLTELIEAAMLVQQPSPVAVVLAAAQQPTHASLSLTSDGLKGVAAPGARDGDRVGRVVEGLARQLRSKLQRDEEKGCLAIDISVLAE